MNPFKIRKATMLSYALQSPIDYYIGHFELFPSAHQIAYRYGMHAISMLHSIITSGLTRIVPADDVSIEIAADCVNLT